MSDLNQQAQLYCPVISYEDPFVVQVERGQGTLREMVSWAISMPDGERPMTQIVLEDGSSIGWSLIAALAEEFGITAYNVDLPPSAGANKSVSLSLFRWLLSMFRSRQPITGSTQQ